MCAAKPSLAFPDSAHHRHDVYSWKLHIAPQLADEERLPAVLIADLCSLLLKPGKSLVEEDGTRIALGRGVEQNNGTFHGGWLQSVTIGDYSTDIKSAHCEALFVALMTFI